MNVLVIGNGGREHALAWKFEQDGYTVTVAPGNGGMKNTLHIAVGDMPGIVSVAAGFDLVVVGPEAPLADGLVDALSQAGIKAFGPSQAAAQLEASKAFAKALMQEQGIPTAEYGEFTDYDAATAFIENFGHPVVIKTDGLAAGKGVIVCDDVRQALAALKTIMLDDAFGVAGNKVIVEERLIGPELSVLAFTDGKTIKTMPPTRDHKRVFDGNEGPNTGGMGAFTPVPGVDSTLVEQVEKTILLPAVDGMAARGMPYQGVLYAGLMLTPDGIRTLEFNCRFGDPETQVILPLLQTDLAEIMLACIEGRLNQVDIAWSQQACATVVAASPGYPGEYPKGLTISGLDKVRDALVFHAGTACDEMGQLVTSGGRVLGVSAIGDDLDAALNTAYREIAHIYFDGIHYRRDIGKNV